MRGPKRHLHPSYAPLPPSPGTPPFRASPHLNVITRTSLFPLPGPARKRKERSRQVGRDVSWHRSYSQPWHSALFTSSFVLGALVVRAFDVTVRSWELGVERLFTSPSVLGSLGVKSFLLYKKPKCCKHLQKIDDFGLFGPSWGAFGALRGCLGAILGRLGVSWGRLGASWAVLGPS